MERRSCRADEVVELYESVGEGFGPEQLLKLFPDEQHDGVRHSRRRLDAHGYVETVTTTAMVVGAQIIRISRVTEKGLRASGAWPASTEQAAQAVLAALDDAADSAPDAEKRSKIQAVRSAFTALGTNASGGIAAAAFAKLMGWG